jgi:hypothetical protein
LSGTAQRRRRPKRSQPAPEAVGVSRAGARDQAGAALPGMRHSAGIARFRERMEHVLRAAGASAPRAPRHRTELAAMGAAIPY